MIQQIRYYKDEDDIKYEEQKNNPKGLKGVQLYDKENCIIKNLVIHKLRIKGFQGLKFYINKSPYPSIVGRNGEYKIKFLEEGIGINQITFDKNDIEKISPQQGLIIEMEYDLAN